MYFDILHAFTAKRDSNALRSLIGDLRHRFAQGQSVTRAQVSNLARGLEASFIANSLEEPLETRELHIEFLNGKIQHSITEMVELEEQSTVLANQVREDLALMGFSLDAWLDKNRVDIEAQRVELQRIIDEYNRQQEKKAAAERGFANIVGGIKIIAGVALMCTGNVAGAALVADGAAGVLSSPEGAGARLDAMKDLREVNKTLHEVAKKLKITEFNSPLHSEKGVKTVQGISDFIETAMPFVRAVVTLPSVDPGLPAMIAEAQRVLSELQQLGSIFTGLRGSLQGVNQAWGVARDIVSDAYRGASFHDHLLIIDLQSRVDVSEFFVDRLFTNRQASNEQNIKARIHAERVEKLMVAHVKVSAEYRKLSIALLAEIEERKVTALSIEHLQRKMEEARRSMLETRSTELASAADIHQLSELEDDSYSTILELTLTVLKLLRRQELALEYLCLSKVNAQVTADPSYETLMRLQGSIDMVLLILLILLILLTLRIRIRILLIIMILLILILNTKGLERLPGGAGGNAGEGLGPDLLGDRLGPCVRLVFSHRQPLPVDLPGASAAAALRREGDQQQHRSLPHGRKREPQQGGHTGHIPRPCHDPRQVFAAVHDI